MVKYGTAVACYCDAQEEKEKNGKSRKIKIIEKKPIFKKFPKGLKKRK